MKATISPKITYVPIQGTLSIHSAKTIETQLQTAILSETDSQIYVDMSKVEFIDSTGLSTILRAYALSEEHQRSLVLYRVSTPVRIVLELTGLDKRLKIA